MMMETLEIVRMIIGRLMPVGSGDIVTCVQERVEMVHVLNQYV